MRSFLAAVSLLSCIPLGKFVPSEKELSRAVFWFPLAGLLFGVVFWGIARGCLVFLPPFLAGAVLTLFPEILTKGFHLDGLADTADGFFSGRDRARKLEIMRDSRIGTMGVLAIVSLFLMKFSAILSLLSAAPLSILWAVPLMILNGRCSMVQHIYFSRYAREDGLGKLMFERKSFGAFLFATALPFLCAACAGLRPGILLLPLLILGWSFVWSLISKRIIHGATGDTIGACEELAELLTLLFFVILIDFRP